MAELVGILNITPDSFSDGGLFLETDRAVTRFDELLAEGASFVDIGAESTRPDASPLSPDEEWRRLEPVLEALHDRGDRISLDTYHAQTVERAASILGKYIVNDVTGFSASSMREAVAANGLECIVSHLPKSSAGIIQSAHKGTLIGDSEQVIEELLEQRNLLMGLGVKQSEIILDPGIGFGKTKRLNWELLEFGTEVPEHRVMIGYSRKKFLGESRMELPINLAVGRVAIKHRARYLRVHDVAGHMPLINQAA